MYDNLTMKLSISESQKINYGNLDFVREITIFKTGEIKKLYTLKNLKIIVSNTSLVIEGSLHKFKLGNNIMDFSRQLTKETLIEISGLLGVDVMPARVYRVDFSTNLFLKNKIENYLASFGNLSRFKKVEYENETKKFRTQKTEIVLYDKLLEFQRNSKISKKDIPIQLQGKNILRVELRLIRNIKKIFLKKIFVYDLIKPEFYNLMKSKLNDYYFRISRNKKVKKMEFITAKEFKDYYYLQGLLSEFKTLNGILEHLENQMKMGILTYKKHFDYKQQILKIFNKQSEFIIENEFIKEADSKFKTNLSINK